MRVASLHLYSFRTGKTVRIVARKLSVESDTRQMLVPAFAFAALTEALEEQVFGLTLLFHRRTKSTYHA